MVNIFSKGCILKEFNPQMTSNTSYNAKSKVSWAEKIQFGINQGVKVLLKAADGTFL